jgi:MYXO-CTERM domain-containing protein
MRFGEGKMALQIPMLTTEAEGASNARAHVAAGSSGCSFAPNRGPLPTSTWGWLLLAALVLQARRRKRR